MKATVHRVPADPTIVPSALVVSSVRVERRGPHEHIVVWNRGAYAGELTVTAGDAEVIARALMPDARIE